MIFKPLKDTLKVDIGLSIILVVIERWMEKEFVCPCNSNNVFVYNTLLGCSSVIIICLTAFIQLYQYMDQEECWDWFVHFWEDIQCCQKDYVRVSSTDSVGNHGAGESSHGSGKGRHDADEGIEDVCRSADNCSKKCCCEDNCKKSCSWDRCMKGCYVLGMLLSLLAPVLTWVMLWYFDGDYYVCKKSNWEGIWNETKETLPHKWCSNETFNSLRRRKSADWFLESQLFSLELLLGLTVCTVPYSIFLIWLNAKIKQEEKDKKKKKGGTDEEDKQEEDSGNTP